MVDTSVLEYLQQHQDEHKAKLCEFLRFPSVANVTSEPDGCGQAAQWVAGYLREMGFDADVHPAARKPNVIGKIEVDPKRPRVLIYGHYDVQPPDPLDEWQTPPFEPTVREGAIYARGASDNKGSHFAYLKALDAYLRATGTLPVNVTVFIEGEEEIGSPNLEPFVKDHREELSADLAVISDSGFFADGLPSIIYGLRGLVYVQVDVQNQTDDAHSGMWGGALANPVHALADMIAAMHDDDGRVTLPGFYDDVAEVSERERREWSALPFDEKAAADAMGVEAFTGGEKGFSVTERRWVRPTLDCNGIVGGYTEPGAKTIIPSRASAKISTRLVPRQDPNKVLEAFRRFVCDHTPAGMHSRVQVLTDAPPLLMSVDSPAVSAARSALKEAFGTDPVLARMGGSIPAVEMLHRIVGLDVIMMGFGQPSDNVHAPNERFGLDRLHRGSVAAAMLLDTLGDALPAGE